MTPQRWAQIKELFERAMELDPSERARFAEHACAGDQELRREVLRLLDNDIEAESFLSNPPVPAYQPCSWPAGKIILDRFRIIRFVGRGGMGEVYEAQDLALNQRVALKTILPEVARDSRILARFKQEITLARKVTDPHVSRIYELFTDSAPFLTMEFLEGLTLSKRIRSRGSLPEAEARVIALQLCQALEAAHRAGVVHRDFKSGNIMVSTRNGEPWAVVTDFGLATMMVLPEAETATGALTRPGAILGTTPYMAPEQLEGGAVAPATDLYALGIVLYEMLTGRTPFPSATPIAAAMERLKNQPDPPSSVVPGLSRVWDGVIKQCLEYEEQKRPASAAEVAGQLTHPNSTHQPRKLIRLLTRRVLIRVAPALLLLGIGLAAWIHRATSYHPPSPDAQKWYNDGITALRDGTYLKAATALQRAVSLDAKFALAHARLADAWTELDFTDKAKTEMLEASSLELIRDLPEIDNEYIEAVRDAITGEFSAAVDRYRHILNALPAADKPFGLVDLGRAYEKANDNDSALESYTKASQNASQYPACFLRLAILDSKLGRLDNAKVAFETANSLYHASSNLEGEAEVAYQQGLAATSQSRLVPARSYIDAALADAHAIHSPQLEMRALLQRSAIEYSSGEIDGARADAESAIALAQNNGIAMFWSTQGLVQLGGAFLSARDYAKAESYFIKAIDLARSNGSQRLEAFASVNLASVRDQQGRADDVIPLAKFAFDYYHTHGFVSQANSAVTLMARAQLNKGDIQGAFQAYQDQATLGRKAGDPKIVSDAEQGLGNVFEDKEEYPEALAHYEKASETGKERDPAFVGYQAFHCASVLSKLGRYDESEQMLKRAESATNADAGLLPEIENVRAGAALARLQYASARDYSLRALKSKVPCSPAASVQALYRLGLAQVHLANPSAGLASCRSALAHAQSEVKTEIAAASLALAEALLGTGSLAEADSLIQNSIEAFHRDGEKESEWRALLIKSQISKSRKTADPGEPARKALDILGVFHHNWDSSNVEAYLSRPDVRAAQLELRKLGQFN